MVDFCTLSPPWDHTTLTTMETKSESKPSFSALSSSVDLQSHSMSPNPNLHPSAHPPAASSPGSSCYELLPFLFSCQGFRGRLLLQISPAGLTAWGTGTPSPSWVSHRSQSAPLIPGTDMWTKHSCCCVGPGDSGCKTAGQVVEPRLRWTAQEGQGCPASGSWQTEQFPHLREPWHGLSLQEAMLI